MRPGVFTMLALANMAESGIGPAGIRSDITAVKRGLTKEALLASCMDGADEDREQGWRDYVDAVMELAQ